MPWKKNFDIDQTLDKAMHQFWRHGYTATSMQDLLDTMSLNRGSLYDTFGDKRSLFIAALKRYDDQVRSARLKTLRNDYAALDAIKMLFQDWIEQLHNDPHRAGCFLTNTALELSAHDKEVAEIVATSQKAIEKFLADNLRLAQDQGQIDARIDSRATARSLLASLIGMLVLSRSQPNRKLIQTIADEALTKLG